jgi:hypothetical protein
MGIKHHGHYEIICDRTGAPMYRTIPDMCGWGDPVLAETVEEAERVAEDNRWKRIDGELTCWWCQKMQRIADRAKAEERG